MPSRFAQIWQPATNNIQLTDREVHLWIAAVPDCLPQLSDFTALLSDDERACASRFHFERDRQRYTVVRGILRKLLAQYLGHSGFSFAYNAYGKPTLGGPSSRLHFNVAHSCDLALFGFTREHEIGVDIEWMRPDFASADLAQRFFAPDEAMALAALPQPLRTQGFFNCWTRKEAWIKARGMGLSLPLHSFAVTLHPDKPAALIRVDGDPAAPQCWSIQALDTSEGYAAAMAIECTNCLPKFFSWPASLISTSLQ
ncbi:MAG: 4'-phosphopantetheinyl transferase superfamily protein [Verrucomicrobia subdivision 3 bacterium]|nr:4'-phosphopantetheinyl transferase superfamily protein [Limisphaerales bacterium]